MKKNLQFIYDILFSVPPFEKRPTPGFILNQYAVVGYNPELIESYILYKSYMMAFWLFTVSTVLYILPLLLQGTSWEMFHIFPDYNQDIPGKPVDYYKYNFPRTIVLPLIGVTCLYATVLSHITRSQHSWNFSGTRPTYIQNMIRVKDKWFGFVRIVLLHSLFPIVLAIAFYYMWSVFEFWNSYALLKSIYDFHSQTLGSFLIIAVFYLLVVPVCANTFFVFIFLLFLELLCSPTTKLRDLFKRG